MDHECVDVLIVGAGLSGVGAACHLRRSCPEKTFAILEARDAVGGTWDLFRYPGIRSDSDMFTLGYSFRPWARAEVIAGGEAILGYVRDTAEAYKIYEQVRFGHDAVRAQWSSAEARWTVEAVCVHSGETVRLRCHFLYLCTGYYRYEEGHTPWFDGIERFAGRVVHPQHWPQDLDWAGRRIVVIGSGATAVTLVPALAREAEHVTMVQRSPSYILSVPGRDPLAEWLLERLPGQRAASIVRWKNVLLTTLIYQLCRRRPELMRGLLRGWAQKQLPAGYDVETHLSPRYDPWDQRLCLAVDGDLFKAISRGSASIVTGEIDAFTESGIRMRDGSELEADLVITATGLNLRVLGGLQLAVDGAEVDVGRSFAYKGMMLCGVPNMAVTLGYTNASWTLRADLVAQYVCRLLRHMGARGAEICTPLAPDPSLQTEPLIGLQSGYVLRSVDQLPKQGIRAPWRLHQNYLKDLRLLKCGRLDDAISFSSRSGARAAESPAEATADWRRVAV